MKDFHFYLMKVIVEKHVLRYYVSMDHYKSKSLEMFISPSQYFSTVIVIMVESNKHIQKVLITNFSFYITEIEKI